MIQASTAVNPPIIANIPEQLTERPQWVCWRLEERDDKPTKMPYTPGTLRRASSIDLMTWRTFSEAVEAYERSEPPYDGIGFVFCSADPYSGIDLDKCRDPETGVIEQWAQEIIDEVSEGYVEVSPSETGIHIIVRGVVRGGSVKKGCVEMYSRDRFFTITGRAL
jgi:primase-polymerase (primpol)-like protein